MFVPCIVKRDISVPCIVKRDISVPCIVKRDICTMHQTKVAGWKRLERADGARAVLALLCQFNPGGRGALQGGTTL